MITKYIWIKIPANAPTILHLLNTHNTIELLKINYAEFSNN